MNAPALTIKNPRGWFAAGVEVARALAILSDGAFKLFIHLCLEAKRDQGVVEISQTELGRTFKKGNHTVRKYLREMEQLGICRLSGFAPVPFSRGRIEICDQYWPYHRKSHVPGPDTASPFVAQIKKLLGERACVHSRFSTADEMLASQWAARAVPLERIEQAILLGCARKYVMWRNHPKQAPIASLRYFEPILEEVERTNVSPEYWNYVRAKMERMEKLWRERHQVHDPAGIGLQGE
jgi:hypothetical protein